MINDLQSENMHLLSWEIHLLTFREHEQRFFLWWISETKNTLLFTFTVKNEVE